MKFSVNEIHKVIDALERVEASNRCIAYELRKLNGDWEAYEKIANECEELSGKFEQARLTKEIMEVE